MDPVIRGSSNHFIVRLMLLWTGMFLSGCNQGDGEQIGRVLQEQAILEADVLEKTRTWEFYWDQSETISNYVTSLRQINLKGCPTEFQEAFRNYIQACAIYEGVARSYGGVNGMIKNA